MQDLPPYAADDDAPAAPPSDDMFSRQRALCAATKGAFFLELPNHVLTYLPGQGQRLVVSWDNLAAFRDGGDLREPWGQTFLQAQGWDVMGVMIKRKDWYRDADLIAALESLRDDGFFRRFPAVSMYGSSMGAFAALAFAPLAPGCTVLAFAPQTSLDPAVVPFEARYPAALRITDWSLPYSDAAAGAPSAARAYVAYDPHEREDRLHVDRLQGPNIIRLPMRHMGHKLPPALMKMKALKPVSLAALAGDLTPAAFARTLRARREAMPWVIDLLNRAGERGHARLALPVADKLLAQSPHWKLRHARRALYARLQG
jgi:hypothetical protein